MPEPEFRQDDHFTVTLYRSVITESSGPAGQVTGQPVRQAAGQVSREIESIVSVLEGEMKRSEIQGKLGLKHRENFINMYLNPAMEQGYVEMKYPGVPNHPGQRYRLTAKGTGLRENGEGL